MIKVENLGEQTKVTILGTEKDIDLEIHAFLESIEEFLFNKQKYIIEE